MTERSRMRFPEERRRRLADDLSWLFGSSSPAKRAEAVALAVIGDELAALNRTLARIADAVERSSTANTGDVPW